MNHRILITDDDVALRSAYQVLLSREDELIVDYAENSTQAHAYMSINEYDAALFDIQLTNDSESGLDLLREMKAKRPLTPIMMMSSMDDAGTIAHCHELGADLFVSKNCGFFAGFSNHVHRLLGGEKAA